MTIAICLKVNDGVVLSADSAATLLMPIVGVGAVSNVYNNANKISNLIKESPIGVISWGCGGIGACSIPTLVKDFRTKFQQEEKISEISIKEISEKFKSFIFDETFMPSFSAAGLPKEQLENSPVKIGFLIAGYSFKAAMAEIYQIDIVNEKCRGPVPIMLNEECGIRFGGDGEAITRLISGFSPMIYNVLHDVMKIDGPNLQKTIDVFQKSLSVPLLHPAMPIQDAIDLARFLVELTINYRRFLPGAPTVGGPIEIATITKHESFKWISRKLFYEMALNPNGGR